MNDLFFIPLTDIPSTREESAKKVGVRGGREGGGEREGEGGREGREGGGREGGGKVVIQNCEFIAIPTVSTKLFVILAVRPSFFFPLAGDSGYGRFKNILSSAAATGEYAKVANGEEGGREGGRGERERKGGSEGDGGQKG